MKSRFGGLRHGTLSFAMASCQIPILVFDRDVRRLALIRLLIDRCTFLEERWPPFAASVMGLTRLGVLGSGYTRRRFLLFLFLSGYG